MITCPPAPIPLVTPTAIDQAELACLRLELADRRTREQVGRDAYLRLQGELQQERLRNAADRRRVDLLVTLARRARTSREGITIHDGDQLFINPPDLRALLDVLLNSGVADPIIPQGTEGQQLARLRAVADQTITDCQAICNLTDESAVEQIAQHIASALGACLRDEHGDKLNPNDRLLDAAPDLLAALRAFIEPLAGMEPDQFTHDTAVNLKAARAAIAKATAP